MGAGDRKANPGRRFRTIQARAVGRSPQANDGRRKWAVSLLKSCRKRSVISRRLGNGMRNEVLKLPLISRRRWTAQPKSFLKLPIVGPSFIAERDDIVYINSHI